MGLPQGRNEVMGVEYRSVSGKWSAGRRCPYPSSRKLEREGPSLTHTVPCGVSAGLGAQCEIPQLEPTWRQAAEALWAPAQHVQRS